MVVAKGLVFMQVAYAVFALCKQNMASAITLHYCTCTKCHNLLGARIQEVENVIMKGLVHGFAVFEINL